MVHSKVIIAQSVLVFRILCRGVLDVFLVPIHQGDSLLNSLHVVAEVAGASQSTLRILLLCIDPQREETAAGQIREA